MLLLNKKLTAERQATSGADQTLAALATIDRA
jgi:hypothetical protein